MALATDLGRRHGVEMLGLHDGRVALAAVPVAAQRAAILAHVLAPRPVARLARDPRLGHLRVVDPFAVPRDEPRLAVGTVAGQTVEVPLRRRLGQARWLQEHGSARGPALLLVEEEEREHVELASVAGRIPVELVVVESRRHDELAANPGRLRRSGLRRRCSRVGHLDPVRVPQTLDVVSLDTRKLGCGLRDRNVEVGGHRVGCDDLGHGPMEAPMPRVVLARMARSTGIGGHEAAVLFDGPLAHLQWTEIRGGTRRRWTPESRANGRAGEQDRAGSQDQATRAPRPQHQRCEARRRHRQVECELNGHGGHAPRMALRLRRTVPPAPRSSGRSAAAAPAAPPAVSRSAYTLAWRQARAISRAVEV